MRFMVAASRPISSSALGCGTRRCSCAAEISSTSRRIASTGASARPTANQVVSATTATITGSPMISSRVMAVVVSSTSTKRPGHHDDPLTVCGLGALGDRDELVVVEWGDRPRGLAWRQPRDGRPACDVRARCDHRAGRSHHLNQLLVAAGHLEDGWPARLELTHNLGGLLCGRSVTSSTIVDRARRSARSRRQ